jgi:hypothetical protein
MPVQSIRVDDILIDGSLFSLKGFLCGPDVRKICPEDSFKRLGILYPAVVFRDGSGRFHIIDGAKRAHFATMDQQENISAIILTETTPVTDIITFILCGKTNEIEQSVLNKVQFVCFAASLEAPEPWILNYLCPVFGFRPHSRFLEDCQRIRKLPEELKSFCHEKRFSMKQLLNLTYYPEEILLQLMEWRNEIQLTASILDEISSNLGDYLKAEEKTIKDFIEESGVQEILRSSLSPRDRTERLREVIRLKRFPVLSEVNARMERTVEDLKLSQEISVDWDRTLENKNVDITVRIQDAKKFSGLIDRLKSLEMKKAVERLLDEL